MSSLKRFRKKHGPETYCQSSNENSLRKYQDRLPVELLNEWRDRGWCGYAMGQIWLVDPDNYLDVVKEWLPDWCEGEDRPPIVFARSAFGDLLISHEKSVGQLNVHYGRYIDIGDEVDDFLEYSLDKSYVSDALDGTLALKAMKKLGPLAPDEMFTFVPALALGGSYDLQYVQKVKMFPQLSILVQLFNEIIIE